MCDSGKPGNNGICKRLKMMAKWSVAVAYSLNLGQTYGI